MKANELRIGNWIDNNVELHKITARDILFLSTGDNMHFCNPIELTEEWLIRLGFDNLGKYGYAKGDFKLEFTSNIITIQDCIFVLWVNSRIIRIKSIHQLQNLYFALTGKEL